MLERIIGKLLSIIGSSLAVDCRSLARSLDFSLLFVRSIRNSLNIQKVDS